MSSRGGKKKSKSVERVESWGVGDWRDRREVLAELKISARDLARLEVYMEAHAVRAAQFFDTKIEFIDALVGMVRGEDGRICSEKLLGLEASKIRAILSAFEAIERSAGFSVGVVNRSANGGESSNNGSLRSKFDELNDRRPIIEGRSSGGDGGG